MTYKHRFLFFIYFFCLETLSTRLRVAWKNRRQFYF